MKPSYKTNDPRGWCGDPKRGAALGRCVIRDAPVDFSGRLYLQQVRLNGGGYDCNGTYWGRRSPGKQLYWVADADGLIDYCVDGRGRENAKARVWAVYPKARFFR